MSLSTAFRRLCRFPASAKPVVPLIESMECRRHLAAHGPTLVTGERFLGTPESITGIVLTFNVALDPVSASVTDSYQVLRKFKTKDDGFFGFGGSGKTSDTDRVGLSSATYDATANTVTLTPKSNFQLGKSFRRIRIQGDGQYALLQADGKRIDGDGNGKEGGDATLTFKGARKNSVSYKDADGDKVVLKLQGPGKILSFVPKTGPAAPILFLRDADAATSQLIGTVKKAKRGDGVTVIQQLSGAGTAQIMIAGNPAFQILTTTP